MGVSSKIEKGLIGRKVDIAMYQQIRGKRPLGICMGRGAEVCCRWRVSVSSERRVSTYGNPSPPNLGVGRKTMR